MGSSIFCNVILATVSTAEYEQSFSGINSCMPCKHAFTWNWSLIRFIVYQMEGPSISKFNSNKCVKIWFLSERNCAVSLCVCVCVCVCMGGGVILILLIVGHRTDCQGKPCIFLLSQHVQGRFSTSSSHAA